MTKRSKRNHFAIQKFISLPFHFLAFTLVPILFFISKNLGQVSSFNNDALILIIASLVCAITIWTILFFFSKNYEKSSLITTVILVSFFSYVPLLKFWQKIPMKLSNNTIELSLYLFLITLVTITTIVIFKFRKSLAIWTKFFNIIALTLLIISLGTIAKYELSQLKINLNKTSERMEIDKMNLKKPENPPDVYYIIFDAFPRSDTLSKLYNYDDKSLDHFFVKKGFFIATKSVSNYAHTHFSLPSSLNMRYLNYLTDEIGGKSNNINLPKEMIRNNDVIYAFKSLGYKIIQIGSEYDHTASNPYADLNINNSDAVIKIGKLSLAVNNYLTTFLETTALYPAIKNLTDNNVRTIRLNAVNNVPKTLKEQGPKFVFAHLTISHPSPLFDKNGAPVSDAVLNSISNIYTDINHNLDQNIFVMKKMKEIIDKLLSNLENQPIIIIQSDHGPTSILGHPHHWERPFENKIEGLKERMRILNAYYFPKVKNPNLYETITPVNTFRVLFNTYFGGNFNLLEDRSYYSDHVNKYEFFDVTKIVK